MTIWQIAFCISVVAVGALLGFFLGALKRAKRLEFLWNMEKAENIKIRAERELEEELKNPPVIRVENRFPEHITASVEIPMEHAENPVVSVAVVKRLKELLGERAFAAANKIETDNIIGMKKVITADLMVVKK